MREPADDEDEAADDEDDAHGHQAPQQAIFICIQ